MIIYKNIRLKKYNTFGLDYNADCLISVKTEKDAFSLFRKEISWKEPLLIVGGGSNILFTCDFSGTILCPEFSGIRIEEQDGENVLISAGAGISWDKLVEWTVNNGYCGLENLSLIPGNVGATPVQNIGAYGVEVKDYIRKVRAIRIYDSTIKEFSNEECGFGYRTSIFKTIEKCKYLITRVYYKLNINSLYNLSYGSLREEVDRTGSISAKNIRKAVIGIRRSKLPDPAITGNAGSFFKNPVVSISKAEELLKRYPKMPDYPDQSGKIKLAAGWLIDQCGWKGKRIGDAAVHENQALVLVNMGKAKGKDIFELSEKIRLSVLEKFGVEIEREVEVIGAI
jgi:UDP-N-acetylmuramate dehydrogenase